MSEEEAYLECQLDIYELTDWEEYELMMEEWYEYCAYRTIR